MSPLSGGLRLDHWVTKMKMKMKNVHKSNFNAEFAVFSWRCSNFGRLDLRLLEGKDNDADGDDSVHVDVAGDGGGHGDIDSVVMGI